MPLTMKKPNISPASEKAPNKAKARAAAKRRVQLFADPDEDELAGQSTLIIGDKSPSDNKYWPKRKGGA